MSETLTPDELKVLSVLRIEEKTLSQIRKCVSDEYGKCITLLFVTSYYSLLYSMDQKGYIKSRWRGRLKYYKISDLGSMAR